MGRCWMSFLVANSLVLPGTEGGGLVLPTAEYSVADTLYVRASQRCPEKQNVKGNVLFFAF